MRWLRAWLRRHSWALASSALLAMVWLTSTAQFVPTGRTSSFAQDVSVPNAPFHDYTADEYNAKRQYEPEGGVAIIFGRSHQTYYSHAVALLDSIRNGLFPDSVWSGQTIRATFAVNPESTTATRTSTNMTLAEARYIDSQHGIYELASTTGAPNRLTPRGLAATAKPTYGGVTGMSAVLVDTLFSGFQRWKTDTLGGDGFRSHVWLDDRYMEGIGPFMSGNGYFQAFGRAHGLNATRTQHAATETYPETGNNYASWPPALFQMGGIERYQGHHLIGEQVSRWNYGARKWDDTAGSGNDPSGTLDSLKTWLDLGAHAHAMGVLLFTGSVNANADGSDITYANLRSIIFHIAHRQYENEVLGLAGLKTLTAEQFAWRVRGVRTGNLLNTHGFQVLGTDTDYTRGAIASGLGRITIGSVPGRPNRVPPFFSDAIQHYSNANDTLATPGSAITPGVGTFPAVFNLTEDGDSVLAAITGGADSLTYALAYPAGNVILSGMQANNRGRPISFVVPTMGCDARAIRVSIQHMVTGSGTTVSGDTMYVAGKFFQFSERWDDHMNEGPSAYHFFSVFSGNADAVARPDTTALPDSLIHKERVRPQFLGALIMADTTATGLPAKLFGTDAAKINWYKRLLAKGTFELQPTFITSARATDFDYRNTLGNPNSLTTAAVSGHETYYSDATLVTAKGVVYTANFTVDINERTDYVSGSVCLENLVGAFSEASIWTVLDITAWPLN